MTGIIALVCGIFIFSLIILTFNGYGVYNDAIKRRISNVITNNSKAAFLEDEISKPLSERFFKPIVKALSEKIKRLTPRNSKSKKAEKNQQSEKLKKMVWKAGFSINVGEYSMIRFVVIVGTAFFFGIISLFLKQKSFFILFVAFGMFFGYTVMRFHLTFRISKRQKSMEQQLPDVLDLLSVNVEAGLGFEQALLHVIGHFEGPLIDELSITYREMTMGRIRRDAFALLADRCGIGEIKTFVASIVQAEQLGISIKNVLRTQAKAMRASRKNKIEEKAMKVSVKILLPMVGFIFPVLLIVLMGPAAVKIIMQFKG